MYVQRSKGIPFLLYFKNALTTLCFCLVRVDTGQFELEGASYPGIVYNVTSILAKHGLSIDTMGTVEEIAPHGGTHLFRMKGVAHAFGPLPKSFSADKIRKELRELGDSLNCDITLEDVDDESYSGSFYGD